MRAHERTTKMAAVAGDYQDGRLTERLQQNVLVDNQLLSLLEVGLPTSVRTAVTRSARAIDRRGPTAVGPTPNAQPAPRRFSVYPGAAAPTGASRVPNSRCTVPELTRAGGSGGDANFVGRSFALPNFATDRP